MNAPSIHFTIHGRAAILEFGKLEFRTSYPQSQGESLTTELSVDLSSVSPGSLKIGQRGVGDFLSRIFGRSDYRVGDSFFDQLYIVRSKPEALARNLFAPHRRDRVVASVRRLGTYVDPLIDLSFQRLKVRVSERLEHERGVMNLLETATDFVTYLLELRGAEGMVVDEALRTEGGKCPVCNAPLEDPLLYCSGCRTAHHEDCWTYLGKCSLFGCRGTDASGNPAP